MHILKQTTGLLMVIVLGLALGFVGSYSYKVFAAVEGPDVEAPAEIRAVAVPDVEVASGVLVPSCIDNYRSWHRSSTFKKSSWDLSFMPAEDKKDREVRGPARREHFMDINGDGLLDYLYSFHLQYPGSTAVGQTLIVRKNRSCIALNTGSGWDIVYKCVANSEVRRTDGKALINDFYGDCAS